MLVVNRDTLRQVNTLYALDEVSLHFAKTADSKDVLRVERSDEELRSDLDVRTVFDQKNSVLQDRVRVRVVSVVRGQNQLALRSRLVNGNATGCVRDRARTLGGTRLEQLGDTRKTLRDVNGRRGTTRVEGTHRELSSGFTDRLRRDDSDRFSEVDGLTRRHRAAIARATHTLRRLTGERRTNHNCGDTGSDEVLDGLAADVGSGFGDDFALAVQCIRGERASKDEVFDVVRGDAVGCDGERKTLGRRAVRFADDDVLRHIDQTTREVTRVGGTKSGVRESLTRTVGGDEVLGDRQSLAVRVLDRGRDDLALRVGDESTHSGDVADLQPVSTSTRGDHAVDGVVALRHFGLQRRQNLDVRFGPDANEFLVALEFRDETLFELSVDLRGQLLVLLDDGLFLFRRHDVAQCDGDARTGRPVETGVLECVKCGCDNHLGVLLGENLDDFGDDTLVGDIRHIGEVRRKQAVEDCLSESRLEGFAVGEAFGFGALREHHTGNADLDFRVDVELLQVERHEPFRDASEDASLARDAGALGGEVVETDDHVLGRNRNRLAVRGLEDVVRREHENARFGLGLERQRDVHGHLVTVEVGVERGTDEGVKLDCLALDELRFERLDSETVKRWCAVQQNRAVADDFFELAPDLGVRALNRALRALDARRESLVLQLLDDIRLEQFERHLLGQSTLVKLQLRSDHDDGTTRVVDALSEKVLTETSLLALEHVGERLERAVSRTGDGTTTTTVVEQRVHRFLQHALFVVLDDLRSHLLVEPLEAVVAVDDSAVQVVEVRRRETSTVQLHHRAKVRRDHGDHTQHHRLGQWHVAGVLTGGNEERVDHAQALDCANLALTLAVRDFVAEDFGFGLELFAVVLTEVLQDVLDCFSAHESGEVGLVKSRLVRVGVALEVVHEETELGVVSPQSTLLE